MDKILDIATKVSTPIAVSGLVVGVLLIVFYGILKLRIFPKLNQTMGRDVISTMMKYLYRLALVSIVLGFVAYLTPFVLGALYPRRPPPPDSATWQMRFDYTLRDAIRRVAELDSHPSVRFERCNDAVMNIKVKKGTYSAKNYAAIIHQLQYNLIEPVPAIQQGKDIYEVRLNEGGLYEIVCHN
ncbi:MAG TPA: hypothetical protein VGW76_14600 [Pyrinomonadaceae bacterium]|nr:hypothetical protein [Pyrinomonadaceae bacterium]